MGHSQLLENCCVPRQIRETRRDVPGSVIISMGARCMLGIGGGDGHVPVRIGPDSRSPSAPAAAPAARAPPGTA